MENKFFKKEISVLIPIVVFSILLFLVPHKTAKAEIVNQRPLSFYGVSTNLTVREEKTIFNNIGVLDVPIGQYVDGVYLYNSDIFGDDFLGESFNIDNSSFNNSYVSSSSSNEIPAIEDKPVTIVKEPADNDSEIMKSIRALKSDNKSVILQTSPQPTSTTVSTNEVDSIEKVIVDNTVTSAQVASAGGYQPVSILAKAKSAWKKVLGF